MYQMWTVYNKMLGLRGVAGAEESLLHLLRLFPFGIRLASGASEILPTSRLCVAAFMALMVFYPVELVC